MSTTATRNLERAVRRIDALAAHRLPTQQLIEGVADELRAAMPIDALVMAATDPDTLRGGPRAGEGDRRRRKPPALCHPRGAGVVRGHRVRLSAVRPGAGRRR